MSASPFQYRAGRWDRWLALLASGERLARALDRRLAAGRWPLEPTDLRRVFADRIRPTPAREPPVDLVPHRPPILFLPALPWAYRFQRPQQLARALGRGGWSVLYVDPFARQRSSPALRLREALPGVAVLRLHLTGEPDPYRDRLAPEVAVALAERIAEGLRELPALVLAQLPFWCDVAEHLRDRFAVPLVYDRLDLHGAFPGVGVHVEPLELKLLRAASLVTASSRDLAERSSPHAVHVLLLRNAAALQDFPMAARSRSARPRIGYVGALGPWFDAEAVRVAALALPGLDWVLAGTVEDGAVAALGALPNVRLVGELPYREVPTLLANLDLALIPFRDLPLTRAVDPCKLYEALAAGLPVVARRLPELERWSEPAVYLYRDGDELAPTIWRALDEDGAEAAPRRRAAVATETWEARAAALVGALDSGASDADADGGERTTRGGSGPSRALRWHSHPTAAKRLDEPSSRGGPATSQ